MTDIARPTETRNELAEHAYWQYCAYKDRTQTKMPMSDRDAFKAAVMALLPRDNCEPYHDPRSHDFKGWVEFDGGRGGTTVCTRCGITSFAHSLRYAP